MVERQDIDALLISALYGELTPAEETRLAAHLESHPADRTALDDLTRAREVVQKSRILTFQYEPPQSVSAMLMQEASRRAPKKTPEGEGWFARFVRSFVQHPAIAAAAMLVVVVGAASIVSRTTDNQFADTPAVETTKNPESAPAVAAETPDPAPSAAAPTGGDQFKVALDEGEGNADVAKTEPAKQALPEADPNVAFYDSSGKGTAVVAKPATKPDTGLEVRRRDPAPKDLEEAKPVETKTAADEKLAKKEQGELSANVSDDGLGAAREQGYVADGRAGGTGAGPSNTRAVTGGAAPGSAPTPAPATVAQAPRTTPAPPPPPPPAKNAVASQRQEITTDTAAPRDAQKSKEKADKVANDPNLAWAKDQHAALVTAVRANNCGRAASLALSIANRTPAYYAQNVETDRSVKGCIAYINREREKDAEVRASRAKKSRLESAEPSAPRRAADEPAKANVDSSK